MDLSKNLTLIKNIVTHASPDFQPASIFSGCLEHANDICADCAFQNLCGDEIKSDQCNFVKLSDIKKLVEDETTKITGTAYCNSQSD